MHIQCLYVYTHVHMHTCIHVILIVRLILIISLFHASLNVIVYYLNISLESGRLHLRAVTDFFILFSNFFFYSYPPQSRRISFEYPLPSPCDGSFFYNTLPLLPKNIYAYFLDFYSIFHFSRFNLICYTVSRNRFFFLMEKLFERFERWIVSFDLEAALRETDGRKTHHRSIAAIIGGVRISYLDARSSRIGTDIPARDTRRMCRH